jgi:hypothetical protein
MHSNPAKQLRSKWLPLLALAVLTGACTTPTPPPAPPATAELPQAWPRCPEWEAQYGAAKGPDLWLTGKQALTLLKPDRRGQAIRIVYEGQTPRLIRNADGSLASDGKLVILGQNVDFYSSGNEDAEISTQPVRLTSPAGWSGWFSFDFSSPEHLQGRNIPTFSW